MSIQEDFLKAFKTGATIVQDGEQHYDVVGFEAEEIDNKVTVQGWAWPMKDKQFVLDTVQQRPDGWLIHSGSTRYLFKPLSEKRSKALLANMEDV